MRPFLRFCPLLILGILSIGCPNLEDTGIKGLRELSNAISEVGKAGEGESKKWREVIERLPKETKPLIEAAEQQLIQDFEVVTHTREQYILSNFNGYVRQVKRSLL